MPVFGRDLQGEGEGEQFVDCGEDGAAVGDGEGAVLTCVRGECKGERGSTGGQKSSWRSTIISAGLNSGVAIVL